MHKVNPVTAHRAAEQLKSARLPSGLSIRHCSTPVEVDFLYREHHIDKVYLQHGVRLQPGDTVLDVGANIGMFAMYAAEAVGPTGRVLACEPAPLTYQACRANVQLHRDWQQAAGCQVAPVEVLPVAVGDHCGDVLLSVYPNASGWSTLHDDRTEMLSNMDSYLTNILEQPQLGPDHKGAMEAALVWAAARLRQLPVAQPLVAWLQRTYVEQALMRGVTQVKVPLTTVSELLQARPDMRKVALLKVDVERAELEVLHGVEPTAWRCIQQVVAEVHDQDGRLAAVQQLLQQAGLTQQTVTQDAHLAGTNLYQVAALRPPAASS